MVYILRGMINNAAFPSVMAPYVPLPPFSGTGEKRNGLEREDLFLTEKFRRGFFRTG